MLRCRIVGAKIINSNSTFRARRAAFSNVIVSQKGVRASLVFLLHLDACWSTYSLHPLALNPSLFTKGKKPLVGRLPLRLEYIEKYFFSTHNSERSMERRIQEHEKEAFNGVLTPELLHLVHLFEENGFEIRIVGGAVRDILLGNEPPKDVDLGTNATPDEMMAMFERNSIKYIATGLQHGTITVHINGKDFEVTTLRIDIDTDGRHATVQFTKDWKLDAERRDLTINAMSLSPNGLIFDYFNGIVDLKNRKVRFVGDPKTRIKEDYLRILRYFRFYGRIALKENQHDVNTLKIIKDMAHGLQDVAVERIWMEVSKILTGNFAPHLLALMYELDVSKAIGLPAISQERMMEFSCIWKNMYGHQPQPVTLLVSLTSTPEEAETVMRHWKLSNSERLLGKFISCHRTMAADSSIKSYQDILVNASNSKQKEITRSHVIELLHLQGRLDFADTIKEWEVPVLPVTGSDLKDIGIKQGPNLGKVLKSVKALWMESHYTLNKEELLSIARKSLR